MALTTPKMGLSVWNQQSDQYDHSQLADNFSKIDFHDHTPGRGMTIPTEGIADGAITADKLAASLNPNLSYSTYKQLLDRSSVLVSLGAFSNYLMLGVGYMDPVSPSAGSSSFAAEYIDPSIYGVVGRTTKFNLGVSMGTNATAIAGNLTFGLNPVTAFAGGSGLITATVGSAIAGSIVSFTTPSSSNKFYLESGDFTAPAAGYYAITVTKTGATVSGSSVGIRANLRVRQV